MPDVRVGIGKLALRGGRRGLLAGAAALVGAGLAKLASPGRTEAAHDTGGSPESLHADVQNTTGGDTRIVGALPNSPILAVSNTPGVISRGVGDGIQGFTGISAGNPAGVRATASATTGQTFGVVGESNSLSLNASGVRGEVYSGATNGVWGENFGTANSGTGVYGLASGSSGATVGVWGRTLSVTSGAIGTLGQATAAAGETFGLHGTSFSPQGAGVYGKGGRYGVLCETASGNGVGIRARVDSGLGMFGSCEGSSGTGVYGESATGGYGVRGASNQGTGVYGAGGQYGVQAEQLVGSGVALRARATAGLGVYGSSGDANGSGVYGENLSGGYGVRAFSTGTAIYAQGSGRAAVFVGDVEIRGNLIRTGSGGSDAAVRDGASGMAGHADLGGRGRLVNGRVAVTLDPAFVAAADTSDYDVVLTPYGDCNGLFVAGRTPGGFEVRELRGGTSSLEFGFRVSARAKSGVTDRRTDGPTAGRGTDGPAIQAPEIPPAWRDAGPRPADIPSEWRDVPPVPDLPRDARDAGGR